MTKQVFTVVGTWGEADAFHIYTFFDADEAMDFVEHVQSYEKAQRAIHPQYTRTAWAVLTETPMTAADTFAHHKAWIEE